MVLRLVALACISTLFLACTEDAPEIDIQEEIKPFVGTYVVDGTAINGVIEFFDSLGYPMGVGYDTIQFENDTLVVSLQGETDTLLMDGFRFDWVPSTPEGRRQAQGVLEDGLIQVIYDNSDGFSSATIEGNVLIQGDDIEMDYAWDSRNTWSQALPRQGFIMATGKRIE